MNNKTKIFGGLLAAAVIAGFGVGTMEAREPRHHVKHEKSFRWERLIVDLLRPDDRGHHRDYRPLPPPPPKHKPFVQAPPRGRGGRR